MALENPGLEPIKSRVFGAGSETQQGLGSFLPQLCAVDLEAKREEEEGFSIQSAVIGAVRR